MLGRARELALGRGALPLAHRARAEIEASGEAVGSSDRSPADSLAPRERRIAEMAAAGMSNREIAQALFVTEKTIEVGLRAVVQS